MTDPRYPIGKFTPPADVTPAIRAAFIADISAAPGQLREATRGLSAAQRKTPYRDGGWTVAQVVHHLADSHLNAYVRIKLALTETAPAIKSYDEALWADLPDAADPEIEPSLRLIEALHVRWASGLRHLTPGDGARAMAYPGRGPTTIDRTLAVYAWHGRHHIAHITALRARMGW